MSNNNKRKIIISSALTIMVCLAIISGSTFAMFTADVGMNVVVKAGNFDVVATPVDADSDDKLDISRGSIINGVETGTPFVVVNQNETDLLKNTISLANMTPGDWISFKIMVKNNSDIAILCQPEIERNDNDLSKFLTVSWRVDGSSTYITEADTPTSAAIPVTSKETITLEIRIALDEKWTAADLKNFSEGQVNYYVHAWQSNVSENPNP